MRDWTARRAVWLGASFLLAFAVWEWAGRWPVSPAFPPFSRTALAFGRMTLDGSLARAYASTLQPLVIGVAISAALGVGPGVAMGLSRSVEWLTLPLFVIAQAAPMAAIIPMIIRLGRKNKLNNIINAVSTRCPSSPPCWPAGMSKAKATTGAAIMASMTPINQPMTLKVNTR